MSAKSLTVPDGNRWEEKGAGVVLALPTWPVCKTKNSGNSKLEPDAPNLHDCVFGKEKSQLFCLFLVFVFIGCLN